METATQVELAKVPCDICGNDDFSVIYHPKMEKLASMVFTPELYQCTAAKTEFCFQLAACKQCRLTLINPRPKTDFLLSLAQNVDDEIYADEKEGRYKTYEKALSELDRVFPPKPNTGYLDISCYLGLFVETLLSKGRDAKGIDICQKIIEKGNQRLGQQRLFAGDISRWTKLMSGEKFDVVTSWDAIEHVDSPVKYLETAYSFLKNDGILVLTTMDYSSLFARITGRKWPWLMPMHLYYFTPTTLQTALEKAGFKVIKRTTYSHVVSLGYLLYKINSKFLGRWRNNRWLKNVFVPVNFGDFMTIYAQKSERLSDGQGKLEKASRRPAEIGPM